MSISYEVSPPLTIREKTEFEAVASKGSSRIGKVIGRSLDIAFDSAETNALVEVSGRLKAPRAQFFQDQRQVSK